MKTPALPDQQALRRRAEAIVRNFESDGSRDGKYLSPELLQKTLYELRVHQIELEMHNQEMRETQLSLDAEYERYFDLYGLAPVGYLTVSAKGLILQANLTAASLLGTARVALVNAPFSHFILKADQNNFEHRSASIGVILFGIQDENQNDLLRGADATMYQAKDGGRNQVRFHNRKVS